MDIHCKFCFRSLNQSYKPRKIDPRRKSVFEDPCSTNRISIIKNQKKNLEPSLNLKHALTINDKAEESQNTEIFYNKILTQDFSISTPYFAVPKLAVKCSIVYSYISVSSFYIFKRDIVVATSVTHVSDDAKEKQTVHNIEVLLGPDLQRYSESAGMKNTAGSKMGFLSFPGWPVADPFYGPRSALKVPDLTDSFSTLQGHDLTSSYFTLTGRTPGVLTGI